MVKETKKERFVRIAEQRTNEALNAIKKIGKCANSAVYEYSESDVDQIIAALELQVEKLKNTLRGEDRFRLSDNQPFGLD